MIKPTPLLTGPLEVALLGATIQSVLHILTLASAQGFFFPKAPGLAQAIEVAILATTHCFTRHQKPAEAMTSSIAAGDKPCYWGV